MNHDRRHFLTTSALLGAGAALLPPAILPAKDISPDSVQPDEGVSAIEDLMREHGVLNRALLIYEEGLRRLRAKEEVAPEIFETTAALVRRFVEEYHEKLEENFIFPEFEKAGKMVDLVKTLRQQHQAGRKVTSLIEQASKPNEFRKPEARNNLTVACEAFIRMYRPHEAREDTVLFPALHKLVSARRLQDLGEQFEKEEDRLFGDDGFEKTVEQVEVIERQLGIDDLAKFTPK